jgi:hypothetical protein
VIVCEPEALGVYVTVQVRVVPEEVQLSELNVPEPELVKVTVPVGSSFVPELVSVTVAVQVPEADSATGDGEQVTVVEVGRIVTPRSKLIVELPA